jgi:4-alpha-glucanotransferase
MEDQSQTDILTGYEDASGNWRDVPTDTIEALKSAMGQPAAGADAAVTVAHCGERKPLRAPAEVTLEDGTVVRCEKTLPGDLPAGYHRLRYLSDDHDSSLIVSPGLCYLPNDLRIWGWAAQLYALRSAASWGMGDFADLRELGRWSRREFHAGILLVNPLQATSPLVPQEPSPYYPGSRRYLNPLYLRIEEIPGAAELKLDLARLAAGGRELNRDAHLDRDAVFKLKKEALALLWAHFPGDSRFERFRREEGEPLAQFAAFSALVEHHGCGWHQWPEDHRDPKSPAVARFVNDHPERIHFYQWLQWLLDNQLAQAADEIPLMQDLPIGVDPDGADAWAWQDIFAAGVAVGGPPDEYNLQGQNWGLPPFVPWKLRAAGYEPFIQTLRGALRYAGGLRIDHVMGLFRLFWIPQGASPAAGGYVRYPADDLLAVLALESQRAKAYIVGEDLGTVEESARKRLSASRVLSYRLLWFEEDRPAEYPELALAAITTHDLPTIAGLWSGADLKAQEQLGLEPNREGTLKIRERLRAMARLRDDTPIEEVITRAYELLAQAPSAIVTATLEDALAQEERPNMPGRPEHSWCQALPASLEQLKTEALPRAIAERLKKRQGMTRRANRNKR